MGLGRAKQRACFPVQQFPRFGIAAMAGRIEQRPKSSSGFCTFFWLTKQPGTCPKQDFPAQLQTILLQIRPGERIEQREPSVLKLRKLFPAYTPREELACDRLQPRLGRGASAVV